MLTNGFKFENQYDGSGNRNATTFIYLAFAEAPFKTKVVIIETAEDHLE